MQVLQRASKPLKLVCLSSLILWAMPMITAAERPWEAGAFAGDARAVLQAAKAVAARADAEATVLYDEAKYVLDAEGRCVTTTRAVYRIETAQGVQDFSAVEAPWAHWRQARPEIRARVITADGTERKLDPATIGEYPLAQRDLQLFEKRRVLKAPLPAVAEGAIVEWEIVVRETAPLFDRGVVKSYSFGYGVPSTQTRLVIDAPAALPLRCVSRLIEPAEPRRSEAGGRVTLTFESGPLEPVEAPDPLIPSDIPQVPYVAFATGKSWADVAAGLNAMIDAKIDVQAVTKVMREATEGAKSREEIAGRLLALVRREVRYTGVEFGEASLIPNPPSETLKRKYGDCKDQSVLLVALLRAAGIDAHLAAIKTGPGPDIERDLAGLGVFDHSIIYVPGPPPLWIDPTGGMSRPGQLPVVDQGRWALVVAPDTRELVRTPVASSSDNRIVVTREFFLPEEGKARVVETTELTGSFESDYRAWYKSSSREDIEKQLRKYAETTYLAEAAGKVEYSDPQELAAPFRIRLEAVGSKLGVTGQADGAVAVSLANVVDGLPERFTAAEEEEGGEPGQATASARAKRKTEVALPNPFVREWRHRITTPAGFAPQALPQGELKKLGPATLSKEFASLKDGVVTATFRFDTGQGRMSWQEAEELRQGVQDLQKAEPILIQFEQVGEAYLAAGKIREALAEFRTLAAQHPKEALHHAQIARALLAAGLGEQARVEARRAIELEPKSTTAHRTLGWVLQHDLIGRRFKKGFDPEGSAASYRQALALDPADATARADLAILLEHNAEGIRYGAGAKLEEAIHEYKALPEELQPSDPLFLNLPLALMWGRKFDELREFARKHENAPQLNDLRLVATAAKEGADAAVKEASRTIPSEETRRNDLNNAAELLIGLRLYPEAATLLGAAARGASNSADLLARAEVLRKTHRHEELPESKDDPRSLVRHFVLSTVLEKDFDGALSMFTVEQRQESQDEEERQQFGKVQRIIASGVRRQGLDPEVAMDVGLSVLDATMEGDDSVGYRIRYQGASLTGSVNQVVFVVREDNEYRLLATQEDLSPLGKEALRRVEKGDLAGARRLLDWAREQVQMPGGDDPLAGPVFPRLWAQGSTGGPDEIRYAAAALIAPGKHCEKAVPVLQEGRAKATSEAARQNFDAALALAFTKLKRYKEALEVAQRLRKAKPESLAAFLMTSSSLHFLERGDELRSLAEERLRRVPDDVWAVRLLAGLADQSGDFPQAQQYLARLMEQGKAEAGDYNNWSWDTLFTGGVTEKAVEAANRACALTQNQQADYLHTLASLYAEVGKTTEAREVIVHALEVSGVEEPEPHDWYVFGRIAEQFGEREAAAAAYRKVTPPKEKAQLSSSTYRLAQKRLAALGMASPGTQQ
jgi:transglutaminase-like putative cysteine protease/tetratricopeptide (TPR) repeat protein